jgi:hypothetical protein
MKRMLFFLCAVLGVLLTAAEARADIPTQPVTDVPKGVDVKGKFVGGLRWNDRNGENWLILTETGEFKSPTQKRADSPDLVDHDAEIYAYLFTKTPAGFRQAWRIVDFNRNCQFDVSASFVQEATSVTDLDDDGVAEVWVLYRTACRSDVSPATMKLIMYEGANKYAMRGETKIGEYGGGMTPDAALKAAPVFLKYAESKWMKFRNEFESNN